MQIYASLAGINQYRYNPEQNNLRGCVNDSRNLIARWNCDHILLTDKQATKKNIMGAWRAQRDKCKPGDRLRLAHSSHGMEEGICCYDLSIKNGNWDPAGFISYDEIADFCKEIPLSILVEILIDACHCSNQLKELGMTYGKAKFMQMTGEVPQFATPAKPTRPSGVRENMVFWAACEPNQTSADAYIDNKPQGAFTAAFLKFDEPGRIRSDIIYYARDWLKKNGYAQRPHLYAWEDNALAAMAEVKV